MLFLHHLEAEFKVFVSTEFSGRHNFDDVSKVMIECFRLYA